MTKTKKIYTYYVVAPGDGNETVARELARLSKIEESEVASFKDARGESHSGWRVDRSFVKTLLLMRIGLSLKFEVYRQEDDGPIQKYPQKKKTADAKMKAVKKRLKEMKTRKAVKK